MRTTTMILATAVLCTAGGMTLAQPSRESASGQAEKALLAKVNARLKDEAARNQCSFKTGTDVLEAGCDKKLKNLANVLIEAGMQFGSSGVKNYKFEVSAHTSTDGDSAANKALTEKRASAVAKALAERGVPAGALVTVGRGGEQPLVKPDDTPAKKAKNRRYEIQARL